MGFRQTIGNEAGILTADIFIDVQPKLIPETGIRTFLTQPEGVPAVDGIIPTEHILVQPTRDRVLDDKLAMMMKHIHLCLSILMLWVSSAQGDTNMTLRVQQALQEKAISAIIVLNDGRKVRAYVAWDQEKKLFRNTTGHGTVFALRPSQISTFQITKDVGAPEYRAALSNALCNLLIPEEVKQFEP